MKQAIVLIVGCALASVALAKLPPPSEEAAAKAAEAKAKAAWSGKVSAYQLCKAQDSTAAYYFRTAKAAGKTPLAPVETPACTEPGPFVYTPEARPIEAAGAHSPPATATSPPSTTAPAATMQPAAPKS